MTVFTLLGRISCREARIDKVRPTCAAVEVSGEVRRALPASVGSGFA